MRPDKRYLIPEKGEEKREVTSIMGRNKRHKLAKAAAAKALVDFETYSEKQQPGKQVTILAPSGKCGDGESNDGKSDDEKTDDGESDDGGSEEEGSDDGKSDYGGSDDGGSDDGKSDAPGGDGNRHHGESDAPAMSNSQTNQALTLFCYRRA